MLMPTLTTTTVAPEPATSLPTARLSVQEVSATSAAGAWARYVRAARGGTVFHDPAWCAAVERAFGHRPLHRAALRGGRIVGILPLMETRSLLGGRMLVSVPYGNYGGIVADDESATGALAAEAERLVAQRGARVLDARSAEALVPNWETLDRYDGFMRELPATCADLERFLPQHARAAARQARQAVTVEHDPSQLRTLWKLYSRSMRRLGSINYPLRFFTELQTLFGDRAWTSIAYFGGRPTAGVFSLVWGETIAPYVQGVDERLRARGAVNLLYLSIVEQAVRRGLRRFDFGRTRKGNAGPAAFKRNQGFRPRALGYQRYVPLGRRAPELTPDSPRFRLARQLWRRLPLAITQPAGAWLARSIPG
jgi:FemAB-related protein (PEP-CTERM system-associated)